MAQHKIAYRLLPVGKEWKMVSLADGLWFNRLAVGEYTLQVKLVFPDGEEGIVNEMSIVVESEWYHTVWAYIVYVLLVIALFYFFYFYSRKRDYRRQMNHDREIVLKENLRLER